jgi:hypothetical protein
MFIGIHLSDRAARLLKHHSKIKFRRSQAVNLQKKLAGEQGGSKIALAEFWEGSTQSP